MSSSKYREISNSSRLRLIGHVQPRALVCREHLVHNQLTQAYLQTDEWHKPQVFFLWLSITRCITVSGSCTPTPPQLLGEHHAHFLLPMTASLATWDFADPPALLALQKYSPDCSLFRFFRIRLFLYLYKEGSSSEPLWYLPGTVKRTETDHLAGAQRWPNPASYYVDFARFPASVSLRF